MVESARVRRRGSGREELLCVGGQGQRPEEQPTRKARGSGREDRPHVQEAVAARAREGLEELSHVEGQEGRR